MTCEGRYPGSYLQTLAGLSLVPGLRRDERGKGAQLQFYPRGAERCVTSISTAHTGEGRYPGVICKPKRDRPWFPAYAGMSGV